MAELTENTKQILKVLTSLQPGEVVSYRDVAKLAGLANGARQVARILHTMSSSYDLPWWRVVRSDGQVAVQGSDRDLQIARLRAEGIQVGENGKVGKSTKD
ncbi:methylated-DNA--protein-cysteine methyltransferase [Weissella oryzae SG25]|uniref:Methylated-DNA--protein-cysteine methyltransferase n=1 Tax=Weissella oryzae (strain DSM 25784 / JCM 18191 / LMG 30913 / SG25) TaxID=1329250 RepID=A0A069CVB7_WEIOS|nr:MGMT family protein [Weissella oryzae]GAK31302.1 methylated-DNA--protein-cysteine methyltransferase [Weissella oryzae SG25]